MREKTVNGYFSIASKKTKTEEKKKSTKTKAKVKTTSAPLE